MSEPPVINPAGVEPATVAGSADALGPTVILPATPPGLAPAPPGSAIAGWFGKLPFLGDFASRRLPETFISQWDAWLQPGLAASRQANGDNWLDLYLTFPVWRFVMPAGLIGDTGWIGVLLPSVDRVGRCFPLTICESVPRRALEDAGLIGIDAHLGALAATGIEALDANSIDVLEQKLRTLAPLKTETNDPAAAVLQKYIPLDAWLRGLPADARAGAWPLNGPIAAALAVAASRFVVATLGERVLWWSPADDAGGGGALLLERFPFSSRLLGNLIGAG